MKKTRLFTALAAVALLTGTGASLVENNAPVAQAATKKAKKSTKKTNKKASKKKAAKYATIKIRKGAPAYQVVFNKKGTNVSKIRPLKSKGKRQALNGFTTKAIWSTKYKKATYYYIGGREAIAVRAKDAKVTSKKKVTKLSTIVKKINAQLKAAQKKQAEYKARAQDWQNKIDAAKPKSFSAKISSATNYWTQGSDGKMNVSKDKLTLGTDLNVLCKLALTSTATDGTKTNIDFYVATTSDGKQVFVPVATVALNDSNAAVPSAEDYSKAIKNVNDIYAQAKKDLGIKDTNN